MKIGIFTFHCADNYGAVLQAYGLQEYLKGLGHEVYIIDYCPTFLVKPTRLFRFNAIPNAGLVLWLSNIFRECLVIPIRCYRHSLFKRFRKKQLNLIKLDLDNPDNGFDAFVFGSDQIWNIEMTEGYNDVYWGNVKTIKGKRNIAYAASAGYVNSLKDCAKIQNLLINFSSISVRETSLLKFLNNNFPQIPVSVCLDPVLLAGRERFDSIADDIKICKPYLLLFQLSHNEHLFQAAKGLAEKNNLEIIEITSYTESLKNEHMLNCVSPERMISYIQSAEYVITNSFHGVVFSILYRKNFNVVCNNSSVAERMISLLEALGLENRLCESVQALVAVDYSEMENKYRALLSNSRSYLSNALANLINKDDLSTK